MNGVVQHEGSGELHGAVDAQVGRDKHELRVSLYPSVLLQVTERL